MFKYLSAVGKQLLTGILTLGLCLSPIASFASEFSTVRGASVALRMESGGFCSGTKITRRLVLSAAHCAQFGETILVDGNKGIVVKRDEINDLLLVQVNLPGRDIVNLATVNPQVDDQIIVVGYPLGLEKFVTEGRIQGYYQDNRYFVSAPIVPGNSGGGVFKKVNGEYVLVGVAVAVFGYGFSIMPHLGLAVDLETIKEFLK